MARLSGQITSVIDYVDVLRFWLRTPLSDKDRRYLNSHCGSLRLARDLRIVEPAWFNPSYRQVVSLYQPTKKALEQLARRGDVLITFSELARDFIFTNETEVQQMLQLTRRHFVQRWHRTRNACAFTDTGNYRTGHRQKGIVFQFYGDRPQKQTGEFCCFHAEAKTTGSVALRRIGIEHPRDLLEFDFDAFWERHLTYLDVERRQLGCWWRNKLNKTKERAKKVEGYDVNKATGNLLCRIHGMDKDGDLSMQALVDRLGRKGSWIVRM